MAERVLGPGGARMSEYEGLTNDELRDILEERDLKVSGTKDELIARLELNDAEREMEEEADEAPEPEPEDEPEPEGEDEYDPYAHLPAQSRPPKGSREGLPPMQTIPLEHRTKVLKDIEDAEA